MRPRTWSSRSSWVAVAPGFSDDERLGPLAPLLVGDTDDRGVEHGVVGEQRLLHLDGRDVLPAGDDDVLGPVAQLDVAVGVHHAEIAGVEPAARERLGGGLGVAVVALHHVVAAHDDLAHRRAVGRHVDQLPVAQLASTTRIRSAWIMPTPCRARSRARCSWSSPSHSRLPLADRVRTVGLGEAVDVHDQEAHPLGTRQRRRAGRGGGGGDDDRVVQRVGPRRVQDHRDDGGRTVEVGDALGVDQLPDRVAADLAQAHLGAADRDQRPARAPAVAVEHRQRPQVDAVVGEGRSAAPRPRALRYAPRWVYMTPLGRPVVPEV